MSREAVDRAIEHPALGPEHPNTRANSRIHARILDALGQTDEAAEVRKRFGIPEPAAAPAAPPAEPATPVNPPASPEAPPAAAPN